MLKRAVKSILRNININSVSGNVIILSTVTFICLLFSTPIIYKVLWNTLYEKGLQENKLQAERIATLVNRDLSNGIPVDVVLEKFQFMLENTTQNHEHFACVVKGNGTVIAHPNPTNVGKDVTGWTLDDGKDIVSFDYAAKKNIKFGGIQTRTNGSQDLSYQSPIDTQDWVVAVHTNLNLLESESLRILKNIGIVLIPIMILIILISSLIVKRIHKKNNEKLENANEKLNSFGKIVCHDASGPLTGIIALVDLIIEDYSEILPEDAQSSLSTVSSATFRLQTMLQDLYLFCNSQVGLKPELEDVDLNILANDIISDLQIQITESNATIVLKDLGTVRSGRSELRLALQNLISNAIKYIEKGKKPIVEIYMDGEMNLCVKDNGIGISEENYEKIFDPFSRLVGSDYDGTGLGLSTCQRLIRYTDGDVSVSSVKGEGSTFKISFQLTT